MDATEKAALKCLGRQASWHVAELPRWIDADVMRCLDEYGFVQAQYGWTGHGEAPWFSPGDSTHTFGGWNIVMLLGDPNRVRLSEKGFAELARMRRRGEMPRDDETPRGRLYFDEKGDLCADGPVPRSECLKALKRQLTMFLTRLESCHRSAEGDYLLHDPRAGYLQGIAVIWGRVFSLTSLIHTQLLTGGTVLKEADGIKIISGMAPHLNAQPLADALKILTWAILYKAHNVFVDAIPGSTVARIRAVAAELELHVEEAERQEAAERADSVGRQAANRVSTMSEASERFKKASLERMLGELEQEGRVTAAKEREWQEKDPAYQALWADPTWKDIVQRWTEVAERHTEMRKPYYGRDRSELSPQELEEVEKSERTQEAELHPLRQEATALMKNYGLPKAPPLDTPARLAEAIELKWVGAEMAGMASSQPDLSGAATKLLREFEPRAAEMLGGVLEASTNDPIRDLFRLVARLKCAGKPDRASNGDSRTSVVGTESGANRPESTSTPMPAKPDGIKAPNQPSAEAAPDAIDRTAAQILIFLSRMPGLERKVSDIRPPNGPTNRGTISARLPALEAKGYVVLRRDEADRISGITITTKGIAFVASIPPAPQSRTN